MKIDHDVSPLLIVLYIPIPRPFHPGVVRRVSASGAGMLKLAIAAGADVVAYAVF
jgi:hypothetical protein